MSLHPCNRIGISSLWLYNAAKWCTRQLWPSCQVWSDLEFTSITVKISVSFVWHGNENVSAPKSKLKMHSTQPTMLNASQRKTSLERTNPEHHTYFAAMQLQYIKSCCVCVANVRFLSQQRKDLLALANCTCKKAQQVFYRRKHDLLACPRTMLQLQCAIMMFSSWPVTKWQ